MKRMTTKEIALWKRANTPGSLTARTADELLALRAEVRRLRNVLLEIRDWSSCFAQCTKTAAKALRRQAKAR